MGQVLAWKCKTTGKLFEQKDAYTKHLRKLAAKRLRQKKIEKLESKREEMLERMGKQVKSINELVEFIKSNWSWFAFNGTINSFNDQRNKLPPHQLVKLSIDNVRFTALASNTHCCPRKNSVTNWHCSPDLPHGYPGWIAQIKFSVDCGHYTYRKKQYLRSGFGSDYFKNTTICTGGGGGSSVSYNYELTLWAADFPAMFEEEMKRRWLAKENSSRDHVWSTLGKKPSNQNHYIKEVPPDWVCPLPLPECVNELL